MLPQHRLRSIQIANWGTFDGYHRLVVPRDGLLVTGESGSGKSSLLDAIATLLVPPASLRFNAAAQQGDRGDQSRNPATYVRGAYRRETDEATDQITTAFLRPDDATWSGIALGYAHPDGRITSLVHLLHIPAGTNRAADVSHLYVIAHEECDLRELAPAIENGVNMRLLHAAHPDWFADRNHPAFSARMQRRLGLRDEQALQLLHKTQSAKNLNNLNHLLRDFMLDRPDTFALAEEAVNQFVELSAAHAGVVDARRQAECLEPLGRLAEAAADAQSRIAELERQGRHMSGHVLHTKLGLAGRLAEQGSERTLELAEQVRDAEDQVRTAQARRDQAQRQVDGISGDLAQLQEAEQLRRERLASVTSRRESLGRACALAGLELPATVEDFTAWRRTMDAEHLEAEVAAAQEASHAAVAARSEAAQRVQAVQADLQALASGSNINPSLLAIRQLVCRETGAPAERLPFAGELIDVKPQHATWQGAIERVLRPLAQTLLVPSDLYQDVADVVDRTQLGARLVYARLTENNDRPLPATSSSSLLHRIELQPGEHHDWLDEHLAERYDYACVETVEELAQCQRGVTRLGQVKHNASRHEKDDRHQLGDRTQWMLGSGVEAKRAALTEQLDEVTTQQETAELALKDAAAGFDRLRERRRLLDELDALSWHEIDLPGAQRDLAEATRRLENKLATTDGLEQARLDLEAAQAERDQAERHVRLLTGHHDSARERLQGLEARITGWREELERIGDVPEDVLETLQRDWPLGEDLDEVELRARTATEQLHREDSEQQAVLSESCNQMLQVMASYRREWPAQSANLGADLASAPDYQAVWQRLADDGLPDYENRFFDLLATQSRNNVGELAQKVRASRELIRGRVKPINRSLRETEFGPGRFLQVRVRDRNLPEVRTFLDDLGRITAGSLSDVMEADASPEQRQRSEERFLQMKALLDRLASTEPADVEWRAQVLDTRRHVDFRAVVIDEDEVQVDAFEGSGGLSGGERQKLVTFCLAAALRYQLAHDGSPVPGYALVVLDEAFDKTDPQFTRACLQVFHDFGFQLLLATPQKMLQALEDYVGGVAVVVRPEEGASSFQEVVFHDEQPMLTEDVAEQDALL